VHEPFKPPEVRAIPSVPEPGYLPALKYTIAFARARWQRRGAIKVLREQMRKDTGMLDGILGALGKEARAMGLENKSLESENLAIAEAEKRRKNADHHCSELSNRQAEENSKFTASESERRGKLEEAEKALSDAKRELSELENQRKDLRDQRKSIETRQKGYLKAATGREAEGEKQVDSAMRLEMRQAAQSLRSDAAELDKERQEVTRQLEALEKPIAQINARVGALKSDVDAAKRALTNLREGHHHRLAEIEAEQGRRSRELAQAEAEIQRREVTLGTLVNLNRIDKPQFRELYEQIDGLRGGIGARSNEIDRLSAEREAYNKASLYRGGVAMGGIVLAFITLIVVLMVAF
jgi:DNA repair exonuclease SbcCD ATPase subunit